MTFGQIDDLTQYRIYRNDTGEFPSLVGLLAVNFSKIAKCFDLYSINYTQVM